MKYLFYLMVFPLIALWIASVVIRFPLVLIAAGAMSVGDYDEADKILDMVIWPVGSR